MYETEVCIIGAGPTGLTLAIELARRSIEFRIVDRAEYPHIGSRGKGIQPRTLEVFDDLGVVERILRAGTPYPRLRVHVGPLSFRTSPLGGRHQATETTPYPNLWLVPQYRTEAILRDRLAELGGCVEFGNAAEWLSDQQGAVLVRLSTGESVSAKYVIGCDGGHSVVRKAISLKLEGESLAKAPSFVSDVEVSSLDHAAWHVWPWTRDGVIALCPLPELEMFQMTTSRVPDSAVEGIIERVSKCTVRRVGWSSSYIAARRMTSRFRVGRVFLAGDAAHIQPPSGGQGLNTGVQDAYNLGWKLAAVLRGSTDTLLDTYEEERLPIAAAALGLSGPPVQDPIDDEKRSNKPTGTSLPGEQSDFRYHVGRSTSRRSYAQHATAKRGQTCSSTCEARTQQSSSRQQTYAF